jgi:hypothetical protein
VRKTKCGPITDNKDESKGEFGMCTQPEMGEQQVRQKWIMELGVQQRKLDAANTRVGAVDAVLAGRAHIHGRTHIRTHAQTHARRGSRTDRESARSSANHLKASVVYFAMQRCSLGGAMV